MSFYKLLVRPILFLKDPERSHESILQLLQNTQKTSWLQKMIKSLMKVSSTKLSQNVFGLTFENPVGLAPGFDKNARVIPATEMLGFGFTEVGTIPLRAQPGNPKPRLFRLLQDQAVINRMGFNSKGSDKALERLQKLPPTTIPIGINFGVNKELESGETVGHNYQEAIKKLHPFANYVVINVSSPNTPGLREFQEKDKLRLLIKDSFQTLLQEKHTIPVLVKIAPDLGDQELDDILNVITETNIDGIIISNTAVFRDNLKSKAKDEVGGLSGKPLFARSNEMIRTTYKKTNGTLPIIGVGGVFSAQDAWEKITAGASLIQLYTGMVYEGPGIARNINKGLMKLLGKNKLDNISQAIGLEHK